MRRFAVFVAVFALPALVGAQDKKAKALTPAEAAKKVGEKCTVEFEVQSTGKSKTGGIMFLNSEKRYKHEKNFTIVLTPKGLAALKKAGIKDPTTHFKGKTIRVTGTVSTFNTPQPQIKVEDAKQIQVVDKKE